LPLAQTGALSEDAVALGLGFVRLIPAQDPVGRAILFLDPSVQNKSLYERESMARSFWYVIHAALETEGAQQKGVVLMVYPKHAQLSQMDRALAKLNIDSLKGCLPIRLSAMHLCHPPTFFQIIFPFVKMLMGERLRKRLKVHAGKNEVVLKKLETFGLTSDKVPTDIGGKLILNHKDWLAKRNDLGK
jgi:hypothetical protein